MSHAAIAHAVNGFFDAFRSKPSAPQVAASRAAQVRVVSRYNEGDDESLLESATSLPRPTLKALEKAIRADGFKGAAVSGWSQGQRGGFTVHYGGDKYEFEISENTTPRPVGEIGRAVAASGRYGKNGRSTGILSDGTRVNVYRYQGAGDEWTAALHYPDGGYSALVMSGRSAEFDEHNVEGPHMGSLIPWDAVPGNIKRDIEQRAVESSMVANGDARKYESGSGPYTVYFETGTLSGGDKTIHHLRRPTLKAAKIEALAQSKLRGGVISVTHKGREIWDTSEISQTPNGRGIYHETSAAKHDMVLVPDHRGRWRIDLVTSAGGNHIDVTEHEAGTAGNSGYSSPELAFRSALDIQRKKGIRGKSHVWIADRDGGLTDYEPMESNGRRRKKGVTVDDLPVSPGSQVLACPRCHAEYSAARGDYFQIPHNEVLACSSCEVPFVLRRGL